MFVVFVARSDVGQEVGFEAVGIIDSKLPTTGVWARKTEEVCSWSLIYLEQLLIHNTLSLSLSVRLSLPPPPPPPPLSLSLSLSDYIYISLSDYLSLSLYATKKVDVPVDDYSKGVVFYHNTDGRIVGVLTWNLFGKMDVARKVCSGEKSLLFVHYYYYYTLYIASFPDLPTPCKH